VKICFVSKEVAGVWGAGIGTYVAEAGKALSSAGHQVWLITKDPGEDKRHLLEKLPGFHKVLYNGQGVDPSEDLDFFHGLPHYRYSHLAHLTILATGEAFDYIEFPDFEAEGIVPIREQKLMGGYPDTVLGVMLHSPTYECLEFDGQLHRMGYDLRHTCHMEEYAIRNAPFRMSPSTRLLEMVAGRLGLPDPAGTVVRYPMELPPGIPDGPSPKGSLEDLSFLYFGRIEPRKGVQNLVKAFRKFPNLRIKLIGGDTWYDPYGRSFKDYLRKRAPRNVEFLDPMPREDLLELVKSVDVCIFPSLFENFPNVCIEAMGLGRVVVGGRNGGMSEMIVHGESGFLVDGSDPEDIARCIEEDLAGNLGRLPEIGRAAARRIREITDPGLYARRIEELVAGARERSSRRVGGDPSSRKVTVVIPFHKGKEWVGEAVDSALGQTHSNLEVLVVNDGSPLPDAREFLEELASRDSRVKVIHKENGGLGSARNKGIEEAEGEYVLFLDDDDVIEPRYAEWAVEALERRPELAFLAPYTKFFDAYDRKVLGYYNPMPFHRDTALIINQFGASGAFFRKSAFLENGIRYDEDLIAYEDWALWMDFARKGVEGDVLPRVCYDYRIRKNSMMSTDGWPNHLSLVGLLIQHHFPVVDEREKDVLVVLNQMWGAAALELRFADAPEDLHQKPVREEEDPGEKEAPGPGPTQVVVPVPPPSVPLRHKLVDALAEKARKVPGLSKALRSAASVVYRLLGGRDGG